MPAARQLRFVSTNNLASAQIWVDDDPATVERDLQAAAAEAAEFGMGLLKLNASSHLAVLDALYGKYRRAAQRADQTLKTAERHGWTSEPQALTAFLTWGLVELARHHPGTALGHLNRGLSASGNQTDRAARLALGICLVQAHIGLSDAEAAFRADANVIAALALTPAAPKTLVRWARVAGAEALLLAARPEEALTRLGATPPGTGFAASWHRVTAARAKLTLGQLPAASELLQPVLRPGWPYREPAIAAHLLSALIADRQHRDAPALTALTAAMDLAQPDGTRRPFLLLGARLTDFLSRYRLLGGRHAAFAADIIGDLAPTTAHSDPTVMIDHLTERETTVLQYLPTMLKAGEIAGDLFVSVNTVKAHLRSIYRKLGVENRREAVERARTFGLL